MDTDETAAREPTADETADETAARELTARNPLSMMSAPTEPDSFRQMAISAAAVAPIEKPPTATRLGGTPDRMTSSSMLRADLSTVASTMLALS